MAGNTGRFLHYAIRKNRIQYIPELLKKCNIEEKNKHGDTPLHTAVHERNLDIVKLLIWNGANVDTKNKKGNSVLHDAVRTDQLSTVQILIEAGAKVDTKDSNGDTPLYVAIHENNIFILKFLLQCRANFSIQNVIGNTPLHTAVILRNSYISTLLVVDYGANVNIKTSHGLVPLHHAAGTNEVGIVKLLLDHGAEVNVRTQDGVFPLYSSIRKENLDIIKLLLDAGADVNSETEDHMWTPLFYAARVSKNTNIIPLLIDNGAEVNDLCIRSSYSCLAHFLLNELIEWEDEYMVETIKKNLKLLVERTDFNLVDKSKKNFIVRILSEKLFSSNKKYFWEIIIKQLAILKTTNSKIDPNLLDYVHKNDNYNNYFSKCMEELKNKC